MRVVTMDPNKCVACNNCEYACSLKQNNDFDRRDSQIRVNFYPEYKACLPLTCFHCSDAWCMEVCPSGAIIRDGETGAVVIVSVRCVGCKMCMLACPFGQIYFNSREKVSSKCDLCDGDPNCVKHCISGALQFEREEEAFQYKRELFDARLKLLLIHQKDKEKD